MERDKKEAQKIIQSLHWGWRLFYWMVGVIFSILFFGWEWDAFTAITLGDLIILVFFSLIFGFLFGLVLASIVGFLTLGKSDKEPYYLGYYDGIRDYPAYKKEQEKLLSMDSKAQAAYIARKWMNEYPRKEKTMME